MTASREFIKRLIELGYSRLTPIQERAIPEIIKGKNVLIIAPTGSGKTEAAIFPIFYKIYTEKPEKISALYITPLRALNRDIELRLQRIANKFDIKVSLKHGDTPRKESKKILQSPPDLLITTPESLLYLITNKKYLQLFRNLKWIIVDEVQELIDEKRGIELSVIIQFLRRNSINKIQLIGISATLGDTEIAKYFLDPEGNVEIIKVDIIKSIKINLEIPRPTKELALKYPEVRLDPKVLARLERLKEIIINNRPVLIFTNTRDTAEFLSSQLALIYGLNVYSHHGSLSREIRTTVESKFREGEIDAVVATSSLELGIDIGKINLVIQYMSPRQVIRLIQRVGRSGHSLDRESKGIIIPSTDIFDILECVSIKNLAYKGYLEKPTVEFKPYDVIAHLTAGLSLINEYKFDELFELFKSVYYFKDLKREEFESIIKYLGEIKIVKYDGESIRPYSRTISYYYNVNMIPDSSKSYLVIDYVSNTKIGVLDEDFVTSLDEDSVFVLAGRIWKVVSIENGKIYVENAKIESGVLPSWFGESIPVEKEVAKNVYEYLYEIYLNNYNNLDLDENTIEEIKSKINEHVRRGYPLPSPNKIVIEVLKDLVIIHSPLGTRGNNTLGAILSQLLSSSSVKVSYQFDAYHIILASSLLFSMEKIRDAMNLIKSLDEASLFNILKKAAVQSPKYKWKLVIEAKRFGAVDHDVELEKILSILRFFRDTLVGEEAIREIISKEYDIEALKEIKDFDIEILEVPSPSPLSQLFLEKLFIISKSNEDLPILLEVFKRRLLNKEVRLICIICGWSEKFKVSDIVENCPKCGSVFLAVTRHDDLDAINIINKNIKGEKLNRSEREKLNELKLTADLFANYKRWAVIGLVTNGVGPHNLGRIIHKLMEGEEKFYEALIEEERKFLRAKKFIVNK